MEDEVNSHCLEETLYIILIALRKLQRQQQPAQ
jgi:hypothetical protein